MDVEEVLPEKEAPENPETEEKPPDDENVETTEGIETETGGGEEKQTEIAEEKKPEVEENVADEEIREIAEKPKKKSKQKKEAKTKKVEAGDAETTETEASGDDKKPKKTKKGKKEKTKPKTEEEDEDEQKTEPQTPKESKSKKKKKTKSTTSVEGDSPKKKGKKEKKGKKAKSETEVTTDDETPGKKKKKKGKKSKTKLLPRQMKVGASAADLQKTPSKASKSVVIEETELQARRSTSRSLTSLKKAQSKSKSRFDFQKTASELQKTLASRSRLTFGSLFSDSSSEEDEVTFEPQKNASKKLRKKKGKKSKETLSEVTEESGEEPPKKKKEKKGKGKKKKKDKVEEIVEEEVPEDEVLVEVYRMRAEAEAKAEERARIEAGESETEAATATTTSKKKKKQGPKKAKKKLTRKEQLELAEKQRLEAEAEAARLAEEERIRLEAERRAAIEKEKREIVEQKIRSENMKEAQEYREQLIEYIDSLKTESKDLKEWNLYVGCDRLPNPSQCDQMNTFIHIWDLMIEETTIDEAAKRTTDILQLLRDLEDLIDTAWGSDLATVHNWKWIRQFFRDNQSKSLDVATYHLLRDIEHNLRRIDIPTADFRYKDDDIAICLWLRVQLPTPLPNPRKPPKARIEIMFPEMKMDVLFPTSIDCEKQAIRAMYMKYDHLSDTCDSFDRPSTPDAYDIELWEATKVEWWNKMKYKFDNRVRPPPPQPVEGEEVMEEPPPEPEYGPEDDIPPVPYRRLEPTASELCIAKENILYKNTREVLGKDVEEHIINLRKFSVLGGTYCLNLIHQPPQPQDFVTIELNLTPLYLPKQLEMVDFFVEYIPPEPIEPGVIRTPEEIEEEMKKQEEEIDQLIFVTLTWPEHVIFLELPFVCRWDEENRHWTKTEIFDLKHNEEKGQITFRTGRFGTFALTTYKYANLPYQAWEIKPEHNGTVTLQITAAILMIEFNVQDGLVALSQLQNSPNNALQDIVGTYFKLPKLIRIMQEAGIDLFPAFDAFYYIENTCEKHWPMAKHLYFNMAQLSPCFNFAWSRWNLPAGRRDIVLQMREYKLDRPKQRNHSMLHVTPLKAIHVDCTEVSATFNEEGVEHMKFYSDLYYLMKGTYTMAVKNKIQMASRELVFTVWELLKATRIHSFS